MGNERAEELIRKYLEGTATPEEEALLESWYIEAAQNQPEITAVTDYDKIKDEILQPLRAEQEKEGLRVPGAQEGLRALRAEQVGGQRPEQPKIKSPIRLWPRIAAAAAVLVILALGGLLIFRKKPTQPGVESQPLANDILPAGMRATLTLLDGRTIPVDSAGSGTLARQGNAVISTLNGQLIYHTGEPSTKQGVSTAYNTLTTRPGEHYSLLLPDGTKAWLNAASSITYPVIFDGKERNVKITGELYFEIVHNAKQPFKVTVKDQVVEDIGTHLNINGYDDDSAIHTTLLEGSIKVIKGNASVVLTPGQQSTLKPDDSGFQIKQVDADQAIAWKNGYFYFDRADIQTVMRELARWYNVKIIYKGDLPKRTFKGKVYRNINASEALSILSYFGAHFHIEGKTITVSS